METDKKSDTWHGRQHRRRPPLTNRTFDPPDEFRDETEVPTLEEESARSRTENSNRKPPSADIVSNRGRKTRSSRIENLDGGTGHMIITNGSSELPGHPRSHLISNGGGVQQRARRKSDQDTSSIATDSSSIGHSRRIGTIGSTGSFDTANSALPRYLQTDSPSKPRGRRCTSDLGFTKQRSTRTAALLKNPAINKHISRMMGLTENDDRVIDTFDGAFKFVHGLPGKPASNANAGDSAGGVAVNSSLTFEPGTFTRMREAQGEGQGEGREVTRHSLRGRPRSCTIEIEKNWTSENCPRCAQERRRKLSGTSTANTRPCSLCGTGDARSSVNAKNHDTINAPDVNGRRPPEQDPDNGAFSRAGVLRASTNSVPQPILAANTTTTTTTRVASSFSIPSFKEFRRMRQASKPNTSNLDFLPSCIEESPLEGEESRTSDIHSQSEESAQEERVVITAEPIKIDKLKLRANMSQSKSEPDLCSIRDDESEDEDDDTSSKSSLQSDSSDSSHVYEEVSTYSYIPSAIEGIDNRSNQQSSIASVENPERESKHKTELRNGSTIDTYTTEVQACDTTYEEIHTTEQRAGLPPRPLPPKRPSRGILRPTPSISPKPSRKAHAEAKKKKQFCDKTFDEDRSTTTTTTSESASQHDSTGHVKVGDSAENATEQTSDLFCSEIVTSDLEVDSFDEDCAKVLAGVGNADGQHSVFRSTSDVSDIKAEESRKKSTRNSRVKLNKSDPFTGGSRTGGQRLSTSVPPGVETVTECTEEKKEKVMNFLANQNGTVASSIDSHSSSLQSIDSSYEEIDFPEVAGTKPTSNSSNHTHGNPTNQSNYEFGSRPTSRPQHKGVPCTDCNKLVPPSDVEPISQTDGSEVSIDLCMAPPLCKKCVSRRTERKEAIQEIVDTEVRYGQDLKVIKQEFYEPIEKSSLLTAEQLQTVFINLNELMAITDHFSDQLLDSLEQANEQGDEDLVTVNIGKLFCETSSMILAFETYCVNQSSAPVLLEQLSSEKELLRIFLKVSQKENAALRKMDLKSFLMLPVQRVMKYPLLLGRVLKVTPAFHEDREFIKTAKSKIEDILGHINSNAKGSMTARIRRRLSSVGRRSHSADCSSSIEIHKVALEMLGWSRNEANFVLTGRISYATPSDHTWVQKKGRNLKFTSIQALLVTRGRGPRCDLFSERLSFPSKTSSVKDCALILVREKLGKFTSLREPLSLDKCVVSIDANYVDAFELYEANGEMYLFKGEDIQDTESWFRNIKFLAKDHGKWRRRRNGLANIMIQTHKSS